MGLKTGPPTPQEVLAKHTTHKTTCVWLGVCGLHPTQCLGVPGLVQTRLCFSAASNVYPFS